MKYEISYANFDNPEAKKHKAIQDCKNYLGGDHFDKLTKEIAKVPDTEDNRNGVIFWLSFAGIEGYPADALIDEYIGTKTERHSDEA
jgi:hypothetical protein